MEKLLTPKETAEMLRVTEKTIREYLREGVLKGYKFGGGKHWKAWRIKITDLEKFVKENHRESKP